MTIRNIEEWEPWTPPRDLRTKLNGSATMGNTKEEKFPLYFPLSPNHHPGPLLTRDMGLRWSSGIGMMQLCTPGMAALVPLLSVSLLFCRHQMCFCFHGRRVITSSCFKHKEAEVCLLVLVHRHYNNLLDILFFFCRNRAARVENKLNVPIISNRLFKAEA